MTWIYSFDCIFKNQIIDQIIKTEIINNKNKPINSAIYGNEFWTLWLNNNKNYIIKLFILGKKNNLWGYKEIINYEDTKHYNCPLSYINKVNIKNNSWKKNVIELHIIKNKIKDISIGDLIVLKDSTPGKLKIVSTNPLVGVDENGIQYKLIKTKIAEILKKQ